MKLYIFTLILFLVTPALSSSRNFFQKKFSNVDGCFILVDTKTNKIIDEFNPKRCLQRYAPMSTFKIPLVAMAFESNYFKDIKQKIKWDGKQRGRKAVNQNQNPKTFIKYSVVWVSRLIVNFLGKKAAEKYVNQFSYGNKLVAGDLNSFWLTKGSIKISPYEQVQFLSKLWQGKLPLSKQTINQVKEVTFDRTINKFKIFGKTGTGCIDGGCENSPGRQLGWFVGIVENSKSTYAFALNFSDKKPRTGYAGPTGRKIVHRYLEKYLKN